MVLAVITFKQKVGEHKMAWTTVDPIVWKPVNEGDSIIGKLVNFELKGENLSSKYYLETDNGSVMVWGSTILDDKMKSVLTGTLVRITYNGKTKNKKGQNVNLFKVEVDK